MVTYEALEKKLKETNRNWKWEYEGYVNEMQKSKKKIDLNTINQPNPSQDEKRK